MFYFYFCILCLAAVFFTVYAIKKRPGINKILIATFFLNIFVFAPVVYKSDGLFSIASATIYVLQIFAANIPFGDFIDKINAFNSFVGYQILASIMYFISPLLAGTFILNFILDNLKAFCILCSLSKKMYVFTELNERSLSLAKSIEKKNCKIIFLNSFAEENTLLKEECSNHGFIIVDYSVEKLFGKINKHILNNLKKLNLAKEVSVFFVDKDENMSLNKMIGFIGNQIENNNVIKTSIFLFCVNSEAELIVDSYKAKFKENNVKNVTLRLIDTAQITSYLTLENYPLFSVMPEMLENGFDVTVIGMGNIGTHIAKDVLWCGQAQHTALKVNLVDYKGSEVMRREFEYKYPELTNKNYNISYYGADVQSSAFDDLLRNDLSTSNYFVVALGDDQMNIVVAHNIRMKYYRYHRTFPVIITVIRDDYKYCSAENVLEKLNIHVVGTNKELYSMDSVVSNSLYYKAYYVDNTYNENKGYASESFEDFLNSMESIIRSNISYAIHIDYKIWDITGVNPHTAGDKTEQMLSLVEKMSSEDKQKLDELEHVRWMAFQRSEGWVSPFSSDCSQDSEILRNNMEIFKQQNIDNIMAGIDYEQKKDVKKASLQKSIFSKMHGCIVPYDELEILDDVMGKPKGEFSDYDKVLNEEMINIWKRYVKERKNV